MNDLRIILANIDQLRSQTVKTKIKRFLLRKRKIRNVGLFLDFQPSMVVQQNIARQFRDIKLEVLEEMKAGKRIPVKF